MLGIMVSVREYDADGFSVRSLFDDTLRFDLLSSSLHAFGL
jgi:hypothetical protein